MSVYNYIHSVYILLMDVDRLPKQILYSELSQTQTKIQGCSEVKRGEE